MATDSDYAWVSQSGLYIAGYCLTLAKGLTPHEILDRLDVLDREDVTGLGALCEGAHAGYDGQRLYVGVRNVGDWGMMLEPNGFVGVNEPARTTLSRGTQLVAHYRNVNAVSRFVWMGDGEQWLDFEPLFPALRQGSRVADAAEAMAAVGLDFEDYGAEPRDIGAATFALAERLTGVPISEDLLDRSEYLCGRVRFR